MEVSRDISPAVRNHVQTVYLFVLAALLAAVAGSYMHVHWYPGGWLTWYGILGGLGLIMGAPRRKEGEKMHILFLLAVSLWEGFSVGPGIRMSICCYPMRSLFGGFVLSDLKLKVVLLNLLLAPVLQVLLWVRSYGAMSVELDFMIWRVPSFVDFLFMLIFSFFFIHCCILVTVLMGAALIFGCFSGATLMSKRLEFLLVGGLVSSAFSFLLWLHFASKIFGSSAVNFRVGVYARVLIFLGYFIFDTLQMMERAQHGGIDHVKQALILSSDFFAVLVPLIVILVKIALRSMDFISFGPKKSADPEDPKKIAEENEDPKKIADTECADLKKTVDPEEKSADLKEESAGSNARAKGGNMELSLHVAMLLGCAFVYFLFE